MVVRRDRRMSEIGWDERRQILMELEVEPTSAVRDRHRVSQNTIGHLRWYFGPKARGSYHRDLVAGARLPVVDEAARLKGEGLTSLEVSRATGIPLENVNRMWHRI